MKVFNGYRFNCESKIVLPVFSLRENSEVAFMAVDDSNIGESWVYNYTHTNK